MRPAVISVFIIGFGACGGEKIVLVVDSRDGVSKESTQLISREALRQAGIVRGTFHVSTQKETINTVFAKLSLCLSGPNIGTKKLCESRPMVNDGVQDNTITDLIDVAHQLAEKIKTRPLP
jgi:hypothetical protein